MRKQQPAVRNGEVWENIPASSLKVAKSLECLEEQKNCVAGPSASYKYLNIIITAYDAPEAHLL